MSEVSPKDAAPDFLDGIADGIEWFTWEGIESAACARCGSSCEFLDCYHCGGDGLIDVDEGNDVVSDWETVNCGHCDGVGGSWHCVSSPEWCEANPLPDRGHIRSTALNAQAWSDA